MNKQRRVLITTTYNEMGVIIDTKAEEVSNKSPKVDKESGELIRCKKCRYKERKGVDYFCDHITGEEIMVSPNDYCSWAEKEVTL